MTDIVIKIYPREDNYVVWSTSMDSPVWVGTRDKALAQPGITPTHLTRADKDGASSRHDEYGYKEDGFTVRDPLDDGDVRWLPRRHLNQFARLMVSRRASAAFALTGPVQ